MPIRQLDQYDHGQRVNLSIQRLQLLLFIASACCIIISVCCCFTEITNSANSALICACSLAICVRYLSSSP